MKRCEIEECGRTGKIARGMCTLHYQRWRKAAKADEVHKMYSSPDEAVQHRVKRAGSCLIWTGYINRDGYARFQTPDGLKMVHRYVWERSKGTIPEGLEVNHTCFNRACINLDHLELVTKSQNAQYRRGAQPNSKSGIRNVHQRGDGWIVRLKVKQRNRTWGPFETVEEAKEEASRRRLEFFGIP